MFSTYHMTNPGVFYNKEDQWEIPAIDIDGNPQLMQPYYTVMRLPERSARRVHPDAAVHARAQGQPRGVDGRAIRSGAVRAARGVRVSAPDGGLRAAADHRAHQSGPGHLAANHAVEPAGLAGDSGHAAGHPDRGSAALRAPAVSARVGRADSRAESRDRRVSGSDRDGRDARRRAGSHFLCRNGRAAPRDHVDLGGSGGYRQRTERTPAGAESRRSRAARAGSPCTTKTR